MLGRVLAVNMNYVGDALMTTPALALLSAACGAPVDVIVGAGALDILRDNPGVGRLIPRVDAGSAGRCLQLIGSARAGRYDTIAILPSIPAYRWAAALALPRRVLYVPPSGSAHMAAHMLESVAGQLGVAPPPLELVLRVSDEARLAVERLLGPDGGRRTLVALNVGATRPQKRWPAAHFRALARRLAARGARVVLTGGASDRAAADVADGGAAEVVNLVGRTSLGELVALLERCSAVVTGDTAAMHIASALAIPLVALFGSTDPAQTGPVGPGRVRILTRGLPCAPCKSHPTCGGAFSCMTEITPDDVLSALDDLGALDAPPTAALSPVAP